MSGSLCDPASLNADEGFTPPPLVAWIRRWLPDAGVWPPQRGRGSKEPPTDEDREAIFRAIILRVGTERFGPPRSSVERQLRAISSLDELEALLMRVMVAEGWEALFPDLQE